MVKILTRFTSFNERQLLTMQFGIHSVKRCDNGIQVINKLKEVAYLSKRNVYTCYADLKTVYVYINIDFYFKNLLPSSDIT